MQYSPLPVMNFEQLESSGTPYILQGKEMRKVQSLMAKYRTRQMEESIYFAKESRSRDEMHRETLKYELTMASRQHEDDRESLLAQVKNLELQVVELKEAVEEMETSSDSMIEEAHHAVGEQDETLEKLTQQNISMVDELKCTKLDLCIKET